jgi:hypothetical protein
VRPVEDRSIPRSSIPALDIRRLWYFLTWAPLLHLLFTYFSGSVRLRYPGTAYLTQYVSLLRLRSVRSLIIVPSSSQRPHTTLEGGKRNRESAPGEPFLRNPSVSYLCREKMRRGQKWISLESTAWNHRGRYSYLLIDPLSMCLWNCLHLSMSLVSECPHFHWNPSMSSRSQLDAKDR